MRGLGGARVPGRALVEGAYLDFRTLGRANVVVPTLALGAIVDGRHRDRRAGAQRRWTAFCSRATRVDTADSYSGPLAGTPPPPRPPSRCTPAASSHGSTTPPTAASSSRGPCSPPPWTSTPPGWSACSQRPATTPATWSSLVGNPNQHWPLWPRSTPRGGDDVRHGCRSDLTSYRLAGRAGPALVASRPRNLSRVPEQERRRPGRPRKWASEPERKRAYRGRKAAELADPIRVRDELHRARQESLTARTDADAARRAAQAWLPGLNRVR